MSLAHPMPRWRHRRTPRRSYGLPCLPHPAHRSASLTYGRTGTMTISRPSRSRSMHGTPATTLAGRPGMRLSAPADMVGTGVPPVFWFVFLAETNLTGERPFSYPTYARTPATTPESNPSPHKLAKTQKCHHNCSRGQVWSVSDMPLATLHATASDSRSCAYE